MAELHSSDMELLSDEERGEDGVIYVHFTSVTQLCDEVAEAEITRCTIDVGAYSN